MSLKICDKNTFQMRSKDCLFIYTFYIFIFVSNSILHKMFAREYELFFSTLKLKSETWRVTTVSGEKLFTESFPKLSQVLTRTKHTKYHQYSGTSCNVVGGARLGGQLMLVVTISIIYRLIYHLIFPFLCSYNLVPKNISDQHLFLGGVYNIGVVKIFKMQNVGIE